MGLQRLLLAAELGAWRRAGRTAQLWWRDDDAREPTPGLERLLALSDSHGVPLTLAVIPDGDRTALAGEVGARRLVRLAQHGVDHRNRREGAHAGEFPPDWTRWELAARLSAGWARLQSLPGATKIYVPPWNDVHPELPAVLAADGYDGWSAAGGWDGAGPPRLDAELDLMRWRKGVRFRGAGRFLATFRKALAARRRDGRWDQPIGLLTHHLDHDEAAWRFLDVFLAWSVEEPALLWTSLEALVARPVREARAA